MASESDLLHDRSEAIRRYKFQDGGPTPHPGVTPSLVPLELKTKMPCNGYYQWDHDIRKAGSSSPPLEVFIFMGVHENSETGKVHGKSRYSSNHNWFVIFASGAWACLGMSKCLYPSHLSDGKGNAVEWNDFFDEKTDVSIMDTLFKSHQYPRLIKSLKKTKNPVWRETLIVDPTQFPNSAWGSCEYLCNWICLIINS
jgi:hypothetical protein